MERFFVEEGIAYYKDPETNEVQYLGVVQYNDRNEITAIIDLVNEGNILKTVQVEENGKKVWYVM